MLGSVSKVMMVVAGLLSAAPAARAQATTDSASAQASQDVPPSPPPSTAGWRDGFALQSDNGDYRLQLNVLLQADERFALDDPHNDVINTFAFRRLRPILQGRVANVFDFYFNPDFAGGAVTVRDAYVDTRFSSAVRVRVGKSKQPFGLERLHSAAFLTFVERALPTTVAPDRDLGLQILGDLSGGVVSYQAGLFNGVAVGESADADTNDGKDVVTRVVLRPFVQRADHPLAGLGLALAASTGQQPAVLPSCRTSGQQRFFAYDRSAVGDGARHRVSPQFFYYYKSVGAFGEYVRSEGAVANGRGSEDIRHQSVMIAGSVVVTGEAASDRGVRPRRVFDADRRTWGALEIAARYHALTVGPSAVALGFAAPGSSRDARAVTLGANWYLNPQIKWVLNLEGTTFDGDPHGARHAETTILIRHQLAF